MGGNVTTFAGSVSGDIENVGTQARFRASSGIVYLYVSDLYNHRIRKISPDNGLVKTLACEFPGFMDGDAEDASFNEPNGLAVSPDGTIYVADFNNHKIRKIT